MSQSLKNEPVKGSEHDRPQCELPVNTDLDCSMNARAADRRYQGYSDYDLMMLRHGKDAPVTCVPPEGIRSVIVVPGEEHYLFTYGLGGCQAVALLTEMSDGHQVATMTHFSRRELENNIERLQGSLPVHRASSALRHTALILAPGCLSLDELKLGHSLTPEDGALVKELTGALQAGLSQELDIRPLGYVMFGRESGLSDLFVIRWGGLSGQPPSYRACDLHCGSMPGFN